MVKDEGKARPGRPLAVDRPLSQTGFLVLWQMMAMVGDHLLPGDVADDGHGSVHLQLLELILAFHPSVPIVSYIQNRQEEAYA